MTVGTRIQARLAAIPMSQSELARRVGVNQSTIAGLIRGKARSSSHLHLIARSLRTSIEYLTGETDDPEAGAPPPTPPPAIVHVMLPVALPSENALSAMFEGMLLAIDLDRGLAPDEVARELAQLLPTALARMQGDLLELPRPPRRRQPRGQSAAAEAPASAEPEYQR